MPVKSLKDCVEFVAGDKTILRETLHRDKGNYKLNYSLAWFKVLPGNHSVKHFLKASEVYYIISGKGKMHIDQETFEVGKDDTVYIPPHSMQWIENLSKTEPIIALAIVDPAWKPELETVLER